MSILEEIKQPIKLEIEDFEARFKASMKSSIPLLDTISNYIIKSKGKQLRPLFVFLSAKAFGKVTDSTHIAGILIELLHTASLVHDDVVDDSHERRGFFSINALWKNKIAVLIGDYLLSKGLLVSIDNNEFGQLKLVSNAVREMSEGELLQLERARKLDITEDIYYEIITKKTASLIVACCACGATSGGASESDIEKMKLFGKYVGIAFQIKDDLFDYSKNGEIGKPTGIDIKEKKMTLPLIYSLNKADKATKRRIITMVKNHSEETEKVNEVIDFVIKSGGVQYATTCMNEYHNKALAILTEMPANEATRSLEKLVEYTIHRKK